MSGETRTILVKMSDGSQRKVSNIPGNAKVTFSKMIPKGGLGYPEGSNCLRIYTSESNQLAVFVGVKEFQDSSLKVESKLITKVKKNKESKFDGSVFESKDEVEEVQGWVEEEF